MGFLTLLKNWSSLNPMKAFLSKAFFREEQNHWNRRYFVQTFFCCYAFLWLQCDSSWRNPQKRLLLCCLHGSVEQIAFIKGSHWIHITKQVGDVLEVALQSHRIHPQSRLLQRTYNCLLGCCLLRGNLWNLSGHLDHGSPPLSGAL